MRSSGAHGGMPVYRVQCVRRGSVIGDENRMMPSEGARGQIIDFAKPN